MRILVVGAGATGGFFGGLLARAGRDVTFLVRPARAQALREHGLQIKSPRGDFTLAPQIAQTGTLSSTFDLILLGVKAYTLEDAMNDFAPAVGPQTAIVPTLNGMRHIDLLTARFGKSAVLGGVCIVSSTLDESGRIVQLTDMQSLTYGELSGELTTRIRQVDATLQGAGFAASASQHIVRDMWEKWVIIATLGASTCLMRGSIGAIVAAGGAPVIEATLEECASVARAAGYPPTDAFVADMRARFTAAGSPLTASMYRDLQAGAKVEADQILGDLVGRAREFGLSTPLLAASYVQLNVYQRGLTQTA
ncbi:MAG TPA: 2-dehydropantoate 2-reductase [Candidatus Baltobacteraceae bacterium]|nr:2-dehydropantoate 2-reductase [Candidatus Baltobacteraceae bacterium]